MDLLYMCTRILLAKAYPSTWFQSPKTILKMPVLHLFTTVTEGLMRRMKPFPAPTLACWHAPMSPSLSVNTRFMLCMLEPKYPILHLFLTVYPSAGLISARSRVSYWLSMSSFIWWKKCFSNVTLLYQVLLGFMLLNCHKLGIISNVNSNSLSKQKFYKANF